MPQQKNGSKSMEIVTVNIPIAFLGHIEKLRDIENVEEFLGFEPSRSEFVRHAIREYIINHYELWDFLRGFDKVQRESNKRRLDIQLNIPELKKPKPKRVPLGRNFEVDIPEVPNEYVQIMKKGINED